MIWLEPSVCFATPLPPDLVFCNLVVCFPPFSFCRFSGGRVIVHESSIVPLRWNDDFRCCLPVLMTFFATADGCRLAVVCLSPLSPQKPRLTRPLVVINERKFRTEVDLIGINLLLEFDSLRELLVSVFVVSYSLSCAVAPRSDFFLLFIASRMVVCAALSVDRKSILRVSPKYRSLRRRRCPRIASLRTRK